MMLGLVGFCLSILDFIGIFLRFLKSIGLSLMALGAIGIFWVNRSHLDNACVNKYLT